MRLSFLPQYIPVGQNTKGPTWSTILTVLNTGETVCRQNFAIWFLENTTKNVN